MLNTSSCISDDQIDDIVSFVSNLSNWVKEEFFCNSYKVFIKEDKSPVTDIDLTAHSKLKNFLQSSFPWIGVVSEEATLDENLNAVSEFANKLCFVIDPIDGTQCLIDRNDHFAINIALLNAKVPVFGLIAVPLRNDIYFTKNDKVYKKSEEGLFEVENPALLKKDVDESQNIVLTCSPRVQKWSGFSSFLRRLERRNINLAQIKWASATIRFTNLIDDNCNTAVFVDRMQDWDIAAGHALLKAFNVPCLRLIDGCTVEYFNQFFKQKAFVATFNSEVVNCFVKH